ncbi:unnamed protein product [Bursaphelenchus xylophilus]|uniref:(pine wood nematode) hypothetical protein n=1 Tax=Bursaphelenchus xylophilus TaxID=6326 RepID=A0A1I7S0I8_BURXY|nr:unnamed protein product [Bursaphelenchus xylophilus]CAG9132274.1 unnamed protein product [Bursaphelenchus xylophilus]
MGSPISNILLFLCVSVYAEYENKLIIDLNNPPPSRRNSRGPVRDDAGVLNEVKEIVFRMEHVFNERIKNLSDRVSRLENRQILHDGDPHIDWKPLGTNGKKIKVFSTEATWSDAKRTCTSYGGKLLEIQSDNENRKITDYLQNFETNLFWIDAQVSVSVRLPAGRYQNFQNNRTEKDCTALNVLGKWVRMDCTERHGFVCQF